MPALDRLGNALHADLTAGQGTAIRQALRATPDVQAELHLKDLGGFAEAVTREPLLSDETHRSAEAVRQALAETVQVRRTETRPVRGDMLPYSVDIVCLDQSGIVSSVSGFFSARGVDIAELDTHSYAAAHTGAPMFSIRLVINVPSRIHLGVLREEFMDFCDHLNLDAILEPVKN